MESPSTAVAADPWQQLAELLANGDRDELERFLEELPPSETARAVSRLEPKQAHKLFELLPGERAADLIVEELSDPQAAQIVAELPLATAAAILDHLPSDDQADVIAHLEPERAEAILARMAPEESADVRELRRYPEGTAGALMITEFLTYSEESRVEEVIADLRDHAEKYADHDVQHLCVVSNAGQLVGLVPLRHLVLSRADQPLAALMIRDPLNLSVDTSLENLEEFFDKYPFSAIPITDENGRLLGVVRRANVEEALAEQAEASLRKFSGLIGGEEFRSMPVWTRSARRLIWLCLTIVLNLVSASVIGLYEATLAQVIALTVFLPVISGMGGSAGNQAIAVSMRELSLGLIKSYEFTRVLTKEMSVGLVNGLVLGLFLGVVAWIYQGNVYLGLVVGTALMLSNLLAVCIGGGLPLLFKRLKVDPAMAAGPVLMTIADMSGFFFALSFATLLLNQLK